MNNRSALIAVLAALVIVGAASSGLSQTAPQPAPPASPAAPANATPVPYTMTMGDMMNTLVEPRHAKLGLAGRAENWPLAASTAPSGRLSPASSRRSRGFAGFRLRNSSMRR
jgi:hypothetical protein